MENESEKDEKQKESSSKILIDSDKLAPTNRVLTISERIKALNEKGFSDTKKSSSQFAMPSSSSSSSVNINKPKPKSLQGKEFPVITTAESSTSAANQSTSSTVDSETLLTSSFNDITSSTLPVGKHELELTDQKNVIVYRGDNRDPEKIAAAGGFYSWSKKHVTEIKKALTDAFISDGPSAHMAGHVRSPNQNYVSTGINTDCGGFGEQSAYLYKMEIPGLKPHDMNEETIGLKIKKERKNINSPEFLMSHLTLQQSEFVAMMPARTEELTFITPIPLSYITSYKKKGTNTWHKMPGTKQ
ncbi:hypothetical protein [Photorhabdus stackebrandtii]|uniref:Uncharacterized protein n=1 Tax=Photorhabdus stackebrandtii TaxID=1123042 RepID=A0A7X5TK23_9GAMM|nr:hypothetical protein [Photorhabdus stackebrandtii]NHB95208.1 hypothetical protein [Photorhabdus stackebrandtii]